MGVLSALPGLCGSSGEVLEGDKPCDGVDKEGVDGAIVLGAGDGPEELLPGRVSHLQQCVDGVLWIACHHRVYLVCCMRLRMNTEATSMFVGDGRDRPDDGWNAEIPRTKLHKSIDNVWSGGSLQR